MSIVIIFFVLLGFIAIIIGVRKRNAEPKDLVTVKSERSNDNVTVISLGINEKELKKQLRNGTLGKRAQNYLPGPAEIAGFYGSEVYSPDGAYGVAINDAYEEDGRKVNGKVALVKDGRVLFRKTLRRPMEAAVNNAGVVVCCDDLNERLSGRFYCFDPTGGHLFSYDATANLDICAVSADSSLAFFESYGSEASDSNCLFIVDIAARSIVHKFIRPFAFNKVEIDAKAQRLALTNADGFVFICDFTGRQMNRDEYEKRVIDVGELHQKISMFENKSPEERLNNSDYMKWLHQSLTDEEMLRMYGKAWIYRRIGELNEGLGNDLLAIEHYQKALDVDAKIGVKRRLEILKKRQWP
jgi:hypothetical protein